MSEAGKQIDKIALEQQEMYRGWCKDQGYGDPYAALEAAAFERGRQTGMREALKGVVIESLSRKPDDVEDDFDEGRESMAAEIIKYCNSRIDAILAAIPETKKEACE